MIGFKVEVYTPDGLTLIGQVLPATVNVSFPLGGKGVLTMTVPPTDPLMLANPGCLDDCVLIVSVPDGLGGWVEAEPYANRMPCKTLVALDGGDLVWSVTAASLDQVWGRDAVILPEYAVNGLMPRSAQRERIMSWPASLYDTGADPLEPWDECFEPVRTIFPDDWPTASGAKWINAAFDAPGARNKLFRSEFEVTTTRTYRIYLSSDESCEVWVAGELVLSTSYEEVGRLHVDTATIILTPGTYAIAARTATVDHSGTGYGMEDSDNYDPLVIAVCDLNAEGNPNDWVNVTNDVAWVACRRTDDNPEPGPTVGGVLVRLWEEAQGIGTDTWDALTLDFDAEEDSDGEPWPPFPGMVLTYAGDDYATIIDRLADNELDCRITPDLVLQARIRQGSDLSSSVTLGGVTRVTPQAEPALGNTIHVLTLQGWTTVLDADAVAAQGKRPVFLQLGTAASIQQGAAVARNAMPDLAYPQARYAVEFSGALDALPLVDFHPGDDVTVPVVGRCRVLALTGAWDGTTEIGWVAEVAESEEGPAS